MTECLFCSLERILNRERQRRPRITKARCERSAAKMAGIEARE
jgi:hypothetical protein